VTEPEPQFSVVICTHNRASLLPRSVVDQTFRNFEVVVVDDGSSDHTTEVVAEITDPLSGTRYRLDQHRERLSRSPGLLADYCAVTGVAAARLGHYREARRFLRMAAGRRKCRVDDAVNGRFSLWRVDQPGTSRPEWNAAVTAVS
jgi:glycosyltransferase involved in cell wall biosynthesis